MSASDGLITRSELRYSEPLAGTYHRNNYGGYDMPTKTIAQRLYAKLLINDLLECWNWQAGTNGGGYGRMRVSGKHKPTHRIMWDLVYGDIPLEMHILHRCDNKACCNPTHLFIGTRSDNMADMVKKGKQAHRISDDDVRAIRSLDKQGVGLVDLSVKFDISTSHIYKIITRRRRKHI